MRIRLNWQSRIKAAVTGEVSVNDFLSGADIGAESTTIDSDKAMKYGVVSSCIRVRAETFASVPFMLYRKTDNGREAATDLLIHDILHNMPNEEMSPFNFKETLMTNFDTGGNVVCEKLFNRQGRFVGLYPYHHEAVTIERDTNTQKLVYKIGQGTDAKTLNRNQVFHVPNLSFDGVIGLSPISYAAEAIKLGLSYETFGVGFYKNGAMPSGVFEHPSELGEDAYDRLKKDLKENYTGLRNHGKPMLLEGGMKWTQTTINPIDAQLIESKGFQIEDICRIYRVPQHLVQKLDRSTYSNIEHQSLEFVMYTMLPIFKRYEDNINMQLLTREERRKGYYIEAKIDGLLRGDTKTRAEAYAAGRQWGWLSVNDIRRLENMKPLGPEGDIYLTPSNMTDSSAGQINAKLAEDIYKIIQGGR
jgi:HK97 family phage portal protein